MVILRGVLKVKFTKYCTCAAENPGELRNFPGTWTGFSIILELEPYMLEAYLRKNGAHNMKKTSMPLRREPVGHIIIPNNFTMVKTTCVRGPTLTRFAMVFV